MSAAENKERFVPHKRFQEKDGTSVVTFVENFFEIRTEIPPRQSPFLGDFEGLPRPPLTLMSVVRKTKRDN
jgi:hypothetical protein